MPNPEPNPPDSRNHPLGAGVSSGLLAAELRLLAARFHDREVTLRDLTLVLHGRGFDLFLVLLSLPFLTPVPLPLLSTPFGIIIAAIGFRLALGQQPRLPSRLIDRPLPARFFSALLLGAARVVRVLEYVLRPRLHFIHSTIAFQRIAGGVIALSGMLLLLPVPVPFSNFLPATAVLFLAAAALERDGLFFVAGCIAFVLACGYFVALPLGGLRLLAHLWPGLF